MTNVSTSNLTTTNGHATVHGHGGNFDMSVIYAVWMYTAWELIYFATTKECP